MVEHVYKKQGDGRDSWVRIEKDADGEIISKTMVYERTVALWKVKSILKIQGLYNTIEAALNELEEPNKTIANMSWQHAESINQFSPTVQLIKQTCQLSDEQIQGIFDAAEAINI